MIEPSATSIPLLSTDRDQDLDPALRFIEEPIGRQCDLDGHRFLSFPVALLSRQVWTSCRGMDSHTPHFTLQQPPEPCAPLKQTKALEMLMQSSRPCYVSRSWAKRTGRGNRILVARPPPASIAPVPAPILGLLEASAEAWAQDCLTCPLTDPDTGVHVHLLGAAHFAPGQHMRLVSIMQQLRPAALALEQPLALSGREGSPIQSHPPFIDALMSAWEPYLTAQPDGSMGSTGSPASTNESRCIQEVEAELQRSGQPEARLGRDVLDPYECFG